MDILLFHCAFIWMENLFVYSKPCEEHLQNLGKVFDRLRKFNITLNSKKSEVLHCTSSGVRGGVSLDPAYLKALSQLPRPQTGKQLQHLLSTLNSIRSTIPDYAHNVAPVQELLKLCQGQANSAKASQVSRIFLVHGVTWMADHDTAFTRVKELVADAVMSAHP